MKKIDYQNIAKNRQIAICHDLRAFLGVQFGWKDFLCKKTFCNSVGGNKCADNHCIESFLLY